MKKSINRFLNQIIIMNNNLELSSNYFLEGQVTDTLLIDKDVINILGKEFSVLTDDKGDFIKIKNIDLDKSTSSRLTCLMWSLNFLYLSLQKSKDQFGTAELRKKVIKLLKRILNGLINSNSLQDLVSITKRIEKERDFIKDGKIEGNYQYIGPNQYS
ncbi:hypothetical protein D1815_12405 [Aquimarina sp. AD1]|nr:hypothetical protein D1815_12405 [Aquimarina sp. AD1]